MESLLDPKREKTYRTHRDINDRDIPKKADKLADPDKYHLTEKSLEKVTVPGQTITVKELLQRHKKGRPQIQE
jgi:hypothetical protein